MNIEINHRGFFLKEEPFYPTIKKTIVLPATATENLDWKREYLQAEELFTKGEWLFFELDFGLEKGPLLLQDSALFFSHTIAIEQFLKIFWSVFKDRTLGISFYRGKYDFEHRLCVDADENPSPLYCGRLFAEYLHRLASFLPDALSAFCLFDLTGIPCKAEQALFLSKERFEHVHFAVKGTSLPLSALILEDEQLRASLRQFPSLGVCLPYDENCSQIAIDILDNLLLQLEEKNIPFRLIPEAFLTEQWDELDHLIVITGALSATGKRKLQGFAAAGGGTISVGKPVGIIEEISLEEFFKGNYLLEK